MKNPIHFPWPRQLACAALLAALGAGGAPAAETPGNIPAGNVLYTVGTTFASGGRDHAYLLWMPTDDDLLRLRSYSVWSKPGAADAAGEFQPESWIEVRTEPAVLEGILRRSERLGQDLGKLEGTIDGLFEIFKPGGGLSRADKLSVIMQGAQDDPRLYHDLLLLARFYPAVSICLGAAWTGPINGLRTYEIRMAAPGDGPHAPDAARRVVGRVTLDPAGYQPLPPPGAPQPVAYKKKLPDDPVVPNLLDPRANLNARMRWATPDALRQRTLLQFGYHVYRVVPAFYDSQGMAGWPADGDAHADDLRNYAEAFPDMVQRASGTPVLIERMLNTMEAADWEADPDTYFFIDDNDRFEPGGVPFNDGDEFMYLVTAVDVLGRDGEPSPATRIQICRTTAPNPPRNLTVRDQVTHPTPTSTRQVFGLSWQAPKEVAEAPVSRFDVYRWVEANDPVTPDGPPPPDPADPDPPEPDPWTAPVMVGSVAFAPGTEWYAFEDTSLGVPPLAEHMNKTWWFTVRAVTVGACFDIPSPHGPPASGVLRDRTGPSGPVAAVAVVNTSVPGIRIESTATSTSLPSPDPGHLNLRLRVTRDALAVDGADFYYRIDNTHTGAPWEDTPLGRAPAGANYLGSIRFHDDGDLESVTDYRIQMPDNGTHTLTVHLRSRDVHGNLAGGFVAGTVSSAPNDTRKEIHVTATHSYRQEAAPTGVSSVKHITRRVDLDQNEVPLVKFQQVPSDVAAWKVFRRIDLGPAVLAADGQGAPPPNSEAPVEVGAANAAEVGLFLQVLDASGNAGKMKELGHFEMAPIEPPAQPMLLPVEPLAGQQATLTWACPPHGVERFHVGVAAVGRLAPETISPDLSEAFELRAAVPVEIGGEPVELDFRFYDTGPLLANNSPEHSVVVDLEDGLSYWFIVEAVTPGGERSRASNLVDYAWVEPAAAGPDVAWPARPSPRVNTAFKTPGGSNSVNGVTIGRLPASAVVTLQPDGTYRILPPVDLRASLFRETAGKREGARPDRSLLPCVVYRYQVPNQQYQDVSGDVVQVTPLLRDIAARVEDIFRQDHTVVYDPYFRFDNHSKEILLRVPQPMISGALYRYLMVLFDENGEIDSVVPTTTFTPPIN